MDVTTVGISGSLLIMDLELTTPEYTLTSLTIAKKNCYSVQHVSLNCNVNKCGCLELTVFAYLKRATSRKILSLKDTLCPRNI
jgi:hypothetical protein